LHLSNEREGKNEKKKLATKIIKEVNVEKKGAMQTSVTRGETKGESLLKKGPEKKKTRQTSEEKTTRKVGKKRRAVSKD